MEKKHGVFQAAFKRGTWSGEEAYDLHVTASRIVLLHAPGADTPQQRQLTHQLGLLGVLINWLIQRSREKKYQRALAAFGPEPTLDQLLTVDPKRNAAIPVDTIRAAKLTKRNKFFTASVAQLSLSLHTAPKPKLFQLRTPEALAACYQAMTAMIPDLLEVEPELKLGQTLRRAI